MKVLLAVAGVAQGLLVFGCASVADVAAGSRREAVLEKLGAPTERSTLAGGERFVYSGGAEGRETWMFEFDASGNLVKRFQARTMERISQVSVGLKQGEVEALLGSSKWTKRFPFLPDELVYIYRFSDDRVPMCFYVAYNTSAIVVSTGMQKEMLGTDRWGPPC